MTSQTYDTVIIGGGIMGLLTAYQIVQAGGRVIVLEKDFIGNSTAASSGNTRSLRTDYASPVYAELAQKSWSKWKQLQADLGTQLIIETGCLNFTITDSSQGYACDAARWLRRDVRRHTVFDNDKELLKTYPQFAHTGFAILEPEAGLGLPKQALGAVLKYLSASPNCTVLEQCNALRINPSNTSCTVLTNLGSYRANTVLLTAALGTSKLLQQIDGSDYRLDLTPDRPQSSVCYIPQNIDNYTAEKLPIFACLDVGIYGHPVVVGMTTGVKVGQYVPPQSVHGGFTGSNTSMSEFVARYVPGLAKARTIPLTHDDQCCYDMTRDGGFAIGIVPGQTNIYVAAGFCGTGYKFAPVIAEILSCYAAQKPQHYDLHCFDLNRQQLQCIME